MNKPMVLSKSSVRRNPKVGAGATYLGEKIEDGVAGAGAAADVDKTQSRILLAAIALFAERGYDSCSMRAIASAVGVKAPSIYNYYSSKEDILVAALDYLMDDFFSFILQDIDSVPRQERLLEIVRRHARYKTQYRVVARANDKLIDREFCQMFLPAERAAQVNKRVAEYRYFVQDLVCDFVPPGSDLNPMVVTVSILTQCDRAAYWFDPAGSLQAEEVVEQLIALTRRLLNLPAS